MSALTEWERKVLERFADACFPNDVSAATRLASTEVATRDIMADYGYISFLSVQSRAARADGPYDLFGRDSDNVPIEFLLFLREGEFSSLEYYRADGEAIKQMPCPAALRVQPD